MDSTSSIDPTASFVLALIAIVVSVLSVIASFAALRQFPKPYMVGRVRRDDPKGWDRPTVVFNLTNMGKASAHDVTFVMRNITLGKFEKLWMVNELAPSIPMESRMSMVTGATRELTDRKDEYGNAISEWPQGDPADMEIELELTWRQAPTMNRVRSKTYRVRILDTNTLISEKFMFHRWVRGIWNWLRSPVDRMRNWPH